MRTRIESIALLCLALTAPAAALAGDEEGDRPRAFRMPPQEAIAACAKLELNATCAFTFDGRAHEGTCRRGPEGEGPIACAPNRHREKGPGGDRKGGERGKSPDARKP